MPDYIFLYSRLKKGLRMFKINREFLVFLVFLLVSIVFWFLQTFKETTTAEITYRLQITGIPKNVIVTSDVPQQISATVSGRGYAILEYITKTEQREIKVDFSSLAKSDGMMTIDNATWKKIVAPLIGRNLKLVSVNPSMLEIYYSTGDHKYVPVAFTGRVGVDAQHVLCGINVEPQYVDIYAPDNQFDTITAIATEALKLTDLKDTTKVRLALIPPTGVKCIPDSVDAVVCVDLYTTKTLKLPIFCENIPQDKILRTFPMTATVTFRVSASLYSSITEDDFALVVDYHSIKPNSDKCQLILRQTPDGIANVRISPQQVDYVIEQE